MVASGLRILFVSLALIALPGFFCYKSDSLLLISLVMPLRPDFKESSCVWESFLSGFAFFSSCCKLVALAELEAVAASISNLTVFLVLIVSLTSSFASAVPRAF